MTTTTTTTMMVWMMMMMTMSISFCFFSFQKRPSSCLFRLCLVVCVCFVCIYAVYVLCCMYLYCWLLLALPSKLLLERSASSLSFCDTPQFVSFDVSRSRSKLYFFCILFGIFLVFFCFLLLISYFCGSRRVAVCCFLGGGGVLVRFLHKTFLHNNISVHNTPTHSSTQTAPNLFNTPI